MFKRQNTLGRKIAQVIFSLFVAFALIVAPLGQQTAQATGWPTVDSLLNGTAIANNATSGVTMAKTVANWIIKILAKILQQIAKVLLNKLTESTVNWINGGFQGSPKFVENPKSFFKNIGDAQLENLIDTVGYNASKFPYGRQMSQVLIGAYKNKNSDIGQSLKYTMTDILGSEAEHFQSSFKVGGWAGYNAYTQNPANNPYGALFKGIDKAAKVVADGKAVVDKELAFGQGFLNQRTCKTYRAGPPPPPPGGQVIPPQPKTDADCVEWKTTSPGSVVQTQLNKALGSKFAQSELGAALGNSLSSIINALTTKLLNQGLSKLSTAIAGNHTTGTSVWMYNGETLDANNTSDTNNPSNWSLADQQNNLNQLFYTGQDIGVTDLITGQPMKLTLIEQAELEAAAYKKILNLMYGISENCTYNTSGPEPVIIDCLPQTSFAKAVMSLDYMTPGPKYHWQQRLADSMQGALQKWSQRASSRKIEKEQEKAQKILEWLQDAADSIPTEIGLQLLTKNVPSYNEAQSLITTGVAYYSKQREYADNYAKTLAAIARLKNIKAQLDSILLYESNPQQATVEEVDTNLEQFMLEHPELMSIDTSHINNYPTAANNTQVDWHARLSQPPVVNPFNFLTPQGQQALKPATKAYGLIYEDLPNSGTITAAQNAAEQVRAEYNNVGAMAVRIQNEIKENSTANLYHVTYGGRQDKFIQASKEPTILKKVIMDQANNKFTVTGPFGNQQIPIVSGQSDFIVAKQNLMNSGIHIIAHGGYLGHVTSAIISSLGSGDIPNQVSGGLEQSAWSNVPIITGPTVNRASILAALQSTSAAPTLGSTSNTVNPSSPWSSDNLDQSHKDTLNALVDQELVLLYSLVAAITPIDLNDDAWVPTSTGTTRLKQALDVIGYADIGLDAPANEDNTPDNAGKIFFCQAIMDKNDNSDQPYRGTFTSLFRRSRMNCNKIYNASLSDYKNN